MTSPSHGEDRRFNSGRAHQLQDYINKIVKNDEVIVSDPALLDTIERDFSPGGPIVIGHKRSKFSMVRLIPENIS